MASSSRRKNSEKLSKEWLLPVHILNVPISENKPLKHGFVPRNSPEGWFFGIELGDLLNTSQSLNKRETCCSL